MEQPRTHSRMMNSSQYFPSEPVNYFQRNVH